MGTKTKTKTEETVPEVYLSASDGAYRVIQGGMPIARDAKSAGEALAAAAGHRLTVADKAWNGDVGVWVPLKEVAHGTR